MRDDKYYNREKQVKMILITYAVAKLDSAKAIFGYGMAMKYIPIPDGIEGDHQCHRETRSKETFPALGESLIHEKELRSKRRNHRTSQKGTVSRYLRSARGQIRIAPGGDAIGPCRG
jgi:hypothetical protein